MRDHVWSGLSNVGALQRTCGTIYLRTSDAACLGKISRDAQLWSFSTISAQSSRSVLSPGRRIFDLAVGFSSSRSADLLEDTKAIRHAPMLDDLPVRKSHDVNHRHRDSLSARLSTHERPVMRARCVAP